MWTDEDDSELHDDPDRIVLSGVRSRRVGGLPEVITSPEGAFVQVSRSETRDVTLSPLRDFEDRSVRKSECHAPGHKGERVLPVRKFSPDPARPNGFDRYCKDCRKALAAKRRKDKRSTTAAPVAGLTK